MEIRITKDKLNILRESSEIMKNTTLDKFEKEVKCFIHYFISDKERKTDFWKLIGYRNADVVNLLKRFGVIVYDDSFDGFKVPKKNFDRKVSRLYYHIFTETVSEPITEDGEGGGEGATTCGSVGGSYEIPLFGVQKRKIGTN